MTHRERLEALLVEAERDFEPRVVVPGYPSMKRYHMQRALTRSDIKAIKWALRLATKPEER